ncbi:MAG: MFS transporter, partial [Cyanobacteria bacterium J06559_3]
AVLGLGMAVSVAPLTTTVMEAVETRYSGTASGINNAVSRVASLLAIALLGIVMLAVFSSSLEARLEPLDLSPQARQSLATQASNLAAAEVPPDLNQATRQAIEQAIAFAFVDGFRVVMGIAVGLAIASAVTAALMIQGRDGKRQTDEGRG